MSRKFHLFQRYGVELEYMIVDAGTLNIRPEADELIRKVAGNVDGDVTRGGIDWSNELSLHLIELKTGKPVVRLKGLTEAFHQEVVFINKLLAKRGARLLPTAMHPWMNPTRESKLWPHGNQEIYDTFHRIFNCRGHGWTNLQSTHLNLPFANDEEFARLHAAIRVLLPALPALSASSPFVDGKVAANLDQRLEVYRHNCSRVRSITGRVVPEPVTTEAEYERKILHRIYRDLKPHDPEQILRDEWANARGAIARFQRNTIEIRVLDIQECPAADLAIVEFIVAVLKELVNGPLLDVEAQNEIPTATLEKLFLNVVQDGGAAKIRSRAYAMLFGITDTAALTLNQFWWLMLERTTTSKTTWRPAIEFILREGSLAERLKRVTGGRCTRPQLKKLYEELADCLAENRLFLP